MVVLFAGAAWRHGLLLDQRAMVLVPVVIAAERLAPVGERVARGIGVDLWGGVVADRASSRTLIHISLTYPTLVSTMACTGW